MKIAVTYENGNVFQHFGHTEQIKLYEIEDNQIKSSQILDTSASGHEKLALFLQEHNADVLICGGIGAGAQVALKNAGVKLFGGVLGNADEAVQNYLNGNLVYNKDVKCTHHDNNNGEHHCADHGRCTK